MTASTTDDRPGVSASLFVAVERSLRRRYRRKDVCVDCDTLNRWIGLLGQVEREYAALAEKVRKEKT